MSTTESAYVPGVCNINPAEIAKRRNIGHIGLAVFLIGLVLLLGLDINRYVRLFLFLPAMLSASGYLQARNHFCVGFAGAGLQNASVGSDNASNISNEKDKLTDKSKARSMNFQSVGIALLVTLIVLVLPQF